MFGFKQYIPFITEQTSKARGIQHLPHPSEAAFIAQSGAINSTLSKLQSAMSGRAAMTRKIDDRMSFQVIKDKEGKVGVKYKGPGAKYNYSVKDIQSQYSQKPYVAEPLTNILKHIHKVLPDKAGEYQGGYLSSLKDRTEEDGMISHKPNTIKYSVSKNSPEGKKLAKAPLSVVLHSRISKTGKTTPVGPNELKDHPDVHVMSHTLSSEERTLNPQAKKKALEHIGAAKKLLQNHTHEHLTGHEETLQRYANSTIDTGEKPNVNGYKKFLDQYHQKRIDKVKTEKAKNEKRKELENAVRHVNDNKGKFDRSFDIHHHIQQATYSIAGALSKTASGGYKHYIDDKEASGEGFVSGGQKIVPRAFTMANRARGAALKAQKAVI